MKMSTCVSAVSTKSSQGRLQSVSFNKERSVWIKISLVDQLLERPIAQNLSSPNEYQQCVHIQFNEVMPHVHKHMCLTQNEDFPLTKNLFCLYGSSHGCFYGSSHNLRVFLWV